jgi:hypothetical protein
MKNLKTKAYKNGVFYLGVLLTVLIGSYLSYHLLSGDKTYFLSGDTTHGHYQFEVECNACHVKPFSDEQDMQQACESCHAKELEKINDSHPKSVFSDPRNTELLSQLDARYCITCHREHKPEITRNYGVTLANDFCFHCHQDIANERQSHQGMEFQDCTTSGCHNFHDNSMLYEKFLIKHINQPDILNKSRLPIPTGLKLWKKKNKIKKSLTFASPDIQENLLAIELYSQQKRQQQSAHQQPDAQSKLNSKISQGVENSSADRQQLTTETTQRTVTEEWQKSIHAKVKANCSSCHLNQQQQEKLGDEFESPSEQCGSCHKRQQSSFLLGKHGMRHALELQPMSTDQARLNVNRDNDDLLSCTSCHNPHSLDVKIAAVDSCLSCHQDQHSKNYKQSAHFSLWQSELDGTLPPGSGVSCASCHLPRIKKGKRVTVNHNQNFNLRPNTKMLRKVCMSCHGLKFSLSSLVDQVLIKNNFSSSPIEIHPTFELLEQRIKQRQEYNQSNNSDE